MSNTSTKNTLSALSEDVLSLTQMSVEMISKLQESLNTTKDTVTAKTFDVNGVERITTFNTLGSLNKKIKELQTNLNTLASIDENGSFIQQPDGTFKKIIVSDLNREPNQLNELNSVNKFKSDINYFFESLMSPKLTVEIDLTDKVERNVNKILSKRVIVYFEVSADNSSTLTTNGQTALTYYNNNFKNKADIDYDTFITWLNSTAGIRSYDVDEEEFDFGYNTVKARGLFDVISSKEENNKIWYSLNTIEYDDLTTGSKRQLVKGDYVIINTPVSTTKYVIDEIDLSNSSAFVNFRRISGYEAIPVGIGVIKYYAETVVKKVANISIGFDEYNFIFVKAINTDSNLIAEKWSKGSSFYSNELSLSSTDSNNGVLLKDYYIANVLDFGEVLKDFVAKRIPAKNGELPNAPTLVPDYFKVVQVNQHLTNSPDLVKIRELQKKKTDLSSEIEQTDTRIKEIDEQLKNQRNPTLAQQNNDLRTKRKSLTNELLSVTREILNNNRTSAISDAKFRLRGFFEYPLAKSTVKSKPQEIIGFIIQYRYSGKGGADSTSLNLKVAGKEAYFTSWNEYRSPIRKREYNSTTKNWEWLVENLTDADTPNTNQVDIPISPDETVEIRVKSISEVGYPESPLESDFSESVIISFPEELKNLINSNKLIVEEALREETRLIFESELTVKGVIPHLSGDNAIKHKAEEISSNSQDANGTFINLFKKLEGIDILLNEYKTNIEKIGQVLTNHEERLQVLENKTGTATSTSTTITSEVYTGDLRVTIDVEGGFMNTVLTPNELKTFKVYPNFTESGSSSSGFSNNDIKVFRNIIKRDIDTVKISLYAVNGDVGLISNKSLNDVGTDMISKLASNNKTVLPFSGYLLPTVIRDTGLFSRQLDNQFIYQVSKSGNGDSHDFSRYNATIASKDNYLGLENEDINSSSNIKWTVANTAYLNNKVEEPNAIVNNINSDYLTRFNLRPTNNIPIISALYVNQGADVINTANNGIKVIESGKSIRIPIAIYQKPTLADVSNISLVKWSNRLNTNNSMIVRGRNVLSRKFTFVVFPIKDNGNPIEYSFILEFQSLPQDISSAYIY